MRVLCIANGLHGAIGDSAVDSLREGLSAVECDFAIRFTQRAGDAFAFAREAVLESEAKASAPSSDTAPVLPFSDTPPLLLVVLGGDGTLHDVLNGAKDANSKNRIHVAVVPTGSGNALATTMLFRDIPHAIESVVRFVSTHQNTKPFRISSFAIADPPPANSNSDAIDWPSPLCFTFCVISFGMHAQVVKQSERFRFFGNRRFFYVAVFNMLLLWVYWVRFWTVGEVAKISPTEFEFEREVEEDSGSSLAYEGEKGFTYFVATKMTHLEPGFHISPTSKYLSSHINIISTCTKSRSQMKALLFGALANGIHLSLPQTSDRKVRGFVFEPISKGMLGWLLGSRDADVCVDGEMWVVPKGKAVFVRDLEEVEQVFEIILPFN
ncbi:hypothetical protein HDU98_001477 [Podochytrium sp. JEL0797]|nr:hypothetical protein HDU98_001477 [Podochytrium sp. JEL0797]